MDNRSIGIFDSGVGGLTVLLELKKPFPMKILFISAIQPECLMEESRRMS